MCELCLAGPVEFGPGGTALLILIVLSPAIALGVLVGAYRAFRAPPEARLRDATIGFFTAFLIGVVLEWAIAGIT